MIPAWDARELRELMDRAAAQEAREERTRRHGGVNHEVSPDCAECRDKWFRWAR